MTPDFLTALLLGCVLDLLLGDPEWLYHPVRLIGRYIRFAEDRLRRRGGNLRRGAVLLTVSTVLLSMGAAAFALFLLSLAGRVFLLAGMVLLDWMGLAAKNMAQEASGVERALEESVAAGRRQVSRIVGRDTRHLDEAGIIRAAVESVAENTTDGVVSPMMYAFLGGPVLLWGFKAVSTLDSMVGYLDEKYRDIGWAGARLDDALNFFPARAASLAMCAAAFLTGLDGRNALRIVKRDHANHLSPNCAWTEAAAAGALRIRLGGTHDYFGKAVVKPFIGDDEREPERKDIRRSVRLLYVSAGLVLAVLTAAALTTAAVPP